MVPKSARGPRSCPVAGGGGGGAGIRVWSGGAALSCGVCGLGFRRQNPPDNSCQILRFLVPFHSLQWWGWFRVKPNILKGEIQSTVEKKADFENGQKIPVIGSIPMLGSSFKTPRGFTARGVLVVRNLILREPTLKLLAQLEAGDFFADLSAEDKEASSDIQRFEQSLF